MHSKLVQFHASPEDINDVVQLLVSVVPSVHLYGWSHARLLRKIPATAPLSLFIGIDRIIASIVPLSGHSTTFGELLESCPGVLIIEIPQVKDGCLREVAAMARTLDERGLNQIEAWGKFIRKLRAGFKSGAFVRDPASGVGRYYRKAHAMKGALDLCQRGIRLLAAAGSAIYDYSTPNPK